MAGIHVLDRRVARGADSLGVVFPHVREEFADVILLRLGEGARNLILLES